MKRGVEMLRKVFTITITIIFLSLLAACKYDLPPDSKKKPHTYEEALNYIKTYLDRDDIILSEETETGETLYGYHYVRYTALVDDISFIVSSQEDCHYDSTIGEFCKTRYNLYNNYNEEKLKSLISEDPFDHFELIPRTDPYLHIYNIAYFDYLLIIHNEEELIEAFNQAKAMYENIIISYPNPRYCVIMEVENSDRPLYMCAYQRDDKDESFGFNDVTREELLVEYVKFYTVSS